MKRLRPIRSTATHPRRGAALYIAVVSVSLLVGVLGLSGLSLVMIERRQAEQSTDMIVARQNAQSAVQLAAAQVAADPDWRTNYQHNVETPRQSLGPRGTGTASWIVTDSDGSLTDADTDLRLAGVGRVNGTVQVTSVAVEPLPQEVGPQTLRANAGTSNISSNFVLRDRAWCQYLKPTLPPEATGWWVTGVDLYCRREGYFYVETLNIRLYKPKDNNWPTKMIINEIAVSSSDISWIWQWHSFEFSGTAVMPPRNGVCIALMTPSPSSAPIAFAYQTGGVTEPDAALLRGNPDWYSYDADEALRYRVHGMYTTDDGGLRPIEGTWQRGTAP